MAFVGAGAVFSLAATTFPPSLSRAAVSAMSDGFVHAGFRVIVAPLCVGSFVPEDSRIIHVALNLDERPGTRNDPPRRCSSGSCVG